MNALTNMDPSLQLQALLERFQKSTKRLTKATAEFEAAKADHGKLQNELTVARDQIDATLSKAPTRSKAPSASAPSSEPKQGKASPRKYSPEVKAEAKRRIEAGKEKTAAIARDLKVSLPAIHLWKQQWGLTKKRAPRSSKPASKPTTRRGSKPKK